MHHPKPLIPLLAACALLASAAAPAEPAAPAARVVQVTGQGEATVAPDLARLSTAIESRHLELATAEARANDSARAALAALKSLRIKPEDISTAGTSVNPEYDWFDNKQTLRGYLVRREINVTVRDLDQVGDVMLKLTKAGVNQINPPVLESSQIKDTERLALSRAVQDASAQARTVAEGLTVKLGPVRTVNASTQGTPPPVPMPRLMAMKAAAADAAPMSGNEQTGFSAGLIRASATIQAEFELLP